MRYSIERADGTHPRIVLRAHPDDWAPEPGQVEVPHKEVARHADPQALDRYWHDVEYEPHRMGADYARLERLLDAGYWFPIPHHEQGSEHEG